MRESKDDESRAKSLERIFEENGYYIPLKIYFGGLAFLEERKNELMNIEVLENETGLNFKKENEPDTKQNYWY